MVRRGNLWKFGSEVKKLCQDKQMQYMYYYGKYRARCNFNKWEALLKVRAEIVGETQVFCHSTQGLSVSLRSEKSLNVFLCYMLYKHMNCFANSCYLFSERRHIGTQGQLMEIWKCGKKSCVR